MNPPQILVVRIDAPSTSEALQMAEQKLGIVEAIVMFMPSKEYPGGGSYIAYRFRRDAEIYLSNK